MQFLVFQLFGPMASWGGTAVGEIRPTDLRPARSALLGLLAGALGIVRNDENEHRRLGGCLAFGARVRTGVPLVDYHTTQLRKPRRQERFRTRKDAIDRPRHELETLLSSRDYRCDALARVAAWKTSSEGPSLERLGAALERPVFTPYLGRKSCPLALPMASKVVKAETLVLALRTMERPQLAGFDRLAEAVEEESLYWEKEESIAGLPAKESRERRDDPVSRSTWTFSRRREFFAPWPGDRDVPE